MRAPRFDCFLRCGAVVAAVLAASVATSASAVTVFSDDFSPYPNGNLSVVAPAIPTNIPDVGTGWLATASAATPIQVASNAAALGTSGQDDYAGFNAAFPSTAGFITTALSINVSAAQAAGDYFSHLSSPLGTTANFYQRLFARSSGNGYQLGLVETSGGAGLPTYGTTVLPFGQVQNVLVRWNFVAGAINDTFAVNVNGSPYLTHAWVSPTAEPTTLAAVNLRQGAAGNAATLTVDNLIVNAVPEPATCGLTAFGLLGLMAARRRRR